jgi:hypothetical protein
MAREDRDGSGIEMEFIGMSPVFFGEVFSGTQEWGKDSSQMVANQGVS